MKLIKIVHQLRLAKGKKKLEVLKEHEDNELWRKFLIYTYDSRISYGVSPPKDTNFDIVDIEDVMFNMLDSLKERMSTGNDAKDLAKDLSKRFGEVPRLILGRSIKAGVSITSINKVYPDLIFEFKSMKGMDVPIFRYPVLSSIKYDGVKIFGFVDGYKSYTLTSSGLEVRIDSLNKDLSKLVSGVYEGELIHGRGKMVDRPVITGKLNSLLSSTITDIKEYSFMVYDYIPLDEWIAKIGILTFKERQERLLATYDPMSFKILPVHHNLLHSDEEVERYTSNLIAEGFEGSISRYDFDVYTWKRVPHLIKKKALRECVLECIGVIPHSNPSKGFIGSLVCEGTIKDKEEGEVFVKVNVGVGLSKMDILREPEYYIGKEIEILYNSVTYPKEGNSLFLPRIKRIVGKI